MPYNNVLCSCQKELQKGDPRICGHAKGDWYSENLVSPLDGMCESRFAYNGDGRIKATKENDKDACMTIKKLNLDSEYLCDLRKKALDSFLDRDIEFAVDEVNLFVQEYLKKGKDGRYNPFWTTIRNQFG